MNRKYILGVLLVLSMVFFFTIPIRAYEDTEYLIYGLGAYGGYVYYGVEMNEGDELTWSFETYSEEFEVSLQITGEDQQISTGKTSDSGIWIAPISNTFYLVFLNYDLLLKRDGFIDIYFEVNVEPQPGPIDWSEYDIGIDLIPLTAIISLATIIIIALKKKRV